MAFLGIPTSRKDLGSAGWIKGAATGGARLAANAVSLLPGRAPSSTQNLRNFADAVDDPNRGYSGTLNPITFVTAAPGSGHRGFTQAPPARPGGGGVVGSEQQFDPYGYGSGGGSAPAYDPNTDPVRIARKRQEIRDLMGTFEQAFNDVLGKVGVLASQKRGEFEKNYSDQQMGLDKNFGTTTTGIDDQFSARNAYHSSYRENAQQQAKDAYEGATGQLVQAKSRDLASVGQFAEQQEAELRAGRPNFNVDDYNQVDDLLSIGQDVQSAMNKLRTTGAGLGTDAQYMQRLNAIAPTQEQGSAALKGMLDKLVNTGTNPDSKRAIAMSTIAKNGGDQTAWMDYFEKQLTQTGSNAVQS